MEDIWNYLKTTKKPIVLYGMGNGADKIISVCRQYDIKISGVFSSDSFVRKKIFHGMPVTNYETTKEKFGGMIILLCFGTALPEVIANIKRIAKENELYAPDVPVYGSTLFCSEYYEKRKDEFNYIYDILADDISKKTFKDIILYKLTGDIHHLFDCETDESEPYQNFFGLSNNEIYLDLGAYRGDTVLSFCERVKQWNKIIAVEPDKKTYSKLITATEKIKNIENINAAVSDKCGKALFSMNGSRGFGHSGKLIQTDILTVDSLNISPTFIKMDIEGAEAAAIKGAKKNNFKV
ncbi:MAG: FkbM family methyltransferase [Clostridia bacterium]|nr:FkbM family methyltransferase [Clostridia bacterium]